MRGYEAVGLLVLAVEERVGVPADELDRGGRQADLQGIEVVEQLAIPVVDRAMRLVGDHQVEEADVEGLEDLHHGRVGRQVDAVFTVLVRPGGDERTRLAREESLEGVVRLLAKLASITQEEDSACPLGPDQGLAQSDGHTGLAGARRLDDQGLAASVGEPLEHFLDGPDLVEPIDDLGVGAEFLDAQPVLRLEDQVFQAVLRIEAVDAPDGVILARVVLPLVPEVDLVAVGAEDHRALAELLSQALRVELGLRSPGLRIFGRPLGLDDTERLAVVAPENIVGRTLAGGGRLMLDRELLGDLR